MILKGIVTHVYETSIEVQYKRSDGLNDYANFPKDIDYKYHDEVIIEVKKVDKTNSQML